MTTIMIDYDTDPFEYRGVIVRKGAHFHHFMTGDPVRDWAQGIRFADEVSPDDFVAREASCYKFEKDVDGYEWRYVDGLGTALTRAGGLPFNIEADLLTLYQKQVDWLYGHLKTINTTVAQKLQADGRKSYKGIAEWAGLVAKAAVLNFQLWQENGIAPDEIRVLHVKRGKMPSKQEKMRL